MFNSLVANSSMCVGMGMQRIGQEWHDYQMVGDIIVQYAPFMRLYTAYCDQFEKSVEHSIGTIR